MTKKHHAADGSADPLSEQVSGPYNWESPEGGSPPLVVIVGGGPAGLFCAIRAAGEGRKIVVLEKMPSCGRKLLLTGLGQCNLTHDGDIGSFPARYGGNGTFLRPALRSFTNTDLIAFCEEQGLLLTIEESGKVFPASRKASDVLALLLAACQDRDVEIHCSEAVRAVGTDGKLFVVRTDHTTWRPAFLVIATGGASYPGTGSTGDGYAMAQSFAHTIVPPAPALAPVYLEDSPFSGLAGISFDGISLSLSRCGKKIRDATGDLLFTHNGLSGPGVLHLSRSIEAGDVLKVAFLPGTDTAGLIRGRAAAAAVQGNRQVKSVLTGFRLPVRFVDRILALAGIPGNRSMAHLAKRERDVLATLLTEFPCTVSRVGGFDEAMVTRGGVSLREINPKTMESRLVRHLYCIGEVLDVDGDTGGYNLQAAFSTAACAARDIALKIQSRS